LGPEEEEGVKAERVRAREGMAGEEVRKERGKVDWVVTLPEAAEMQGTQAHN
jgi:hypothetical protein